MSTFHWKGRSIVRRLSKSKQNWKEQFCTKWRYLLNRWMCSLQVDIRPGLAFFPSWRSQISMSIIEIFAKIVDMFFPKNLQELTIFVKFITQRRNREFLIFSWEFCCFTRKMIRKWSVLGYSQIRLLGLHKNVMGFCLVSSRTHFMKM